MCPIKDERFNRLIRLRKDFLNVREVLMHLGRTSIFFLGLIVFFPFIEYKRPGSYECDVKQNRQAQMLHSFGGRTKLIPAVKTKCMPLNNDQV